MPNLRSFVRWFAAVVPASLAMVLSTQAGAQAVPASSPATPAPLVTLMSDATTLGAIIRETAESPISERSGRLIDQDGAAAMERKKQEGYF